MSSDRLNVKVVSNQNSVELTKNENTVVISDKNRDTSINVLQKETAVVTVASKGPKGDKGDKGDTGIAVTNQIATGSITASVDIGTDTFRVQRGSSTFFNINSSGSVGIGVANPTLGLLQVGTITNPHANVYISAGNTGTSSLTVRAINGFSGHQRTYNPVGGSDSLNFIQLLDGDTTSATDQPIGRIIFSSNDTDSGGTNTTKAFIEAVSEDATPDTFLAFGTAQASTSVTERMRITSVGNVGIGTTTPTNTLQVNGGITATSITASSLNILSGNIKIDNSYKILGDSNHLITYNYDSNFPSSTSSSFGLVNIGGVGSYITAREDNLFGSSTILQFFTQGVERARITAGGRLGINTITPGARLVVKGDSSLSSGVTFQALNSSDTTLLYVRDDGNIGIGTTTPQSQLHITGANALFTLSPLHPLPTSSVPSASFATSGSGANLKPYFWNGSSWNALY